MMSFFIAGVVAARRQFIALVAVTLFMSFIDLLNNFGQESLAMNLVTFRIPASPFLGWTYLIMAMGLALTSDRSIELTSDRIRRGSQFMRSLPPAVAFRVVAFQCGLAAIMCAVLLLAPPRPLIELSSYFGCAGISLIIWAGMTSIGVAYFGANAHAALKAR